MNVNWQNWAVAIGLSMGVLLLWQSFVIDPMMEQDRTRQAEQAMQDGARPDGTLPDAAAPDTPQAGAGGTAPTLPDSLQPLPTREEALRQSDRVKIHSSAVDGSVRLNGARIDDLKLLRYRETVDPASADITLLSPQGTPNAYYADVGWIAPPASGFEVPGPNTPWRIVQGQMLTPETPLVLVWDSPQNIRFRRKIEVDGNYMFTITDTIENGSAATVTAHPYGLVARRGHEEHVANWILHEGMIGVFNDTLKESTWAHIDEERMERLESTGGWLGMTDKYWMTALVPPQDTAFQARFSASDEAGRKLYQTDLLMPAREIAPGGRTEVVHHVFAGAKKVSIIDAYGASLGIERFDLAIDWGWFFFLTKPIFLGLEFLFLIFGNMGVAILVLTLLIKAIFYPLADTSYRAMTKMKKLQPEMVRLKELYPNDPQKQQQEMMALYQREKVNPLSGCLPILVQIPVFFALYKVLYVSIEMRHAPFFGWIQDLSAPDPTSIFNLFGLLPYEVPPYLWIGVWPLIMGVTMWVQQKMQPAAPDPVQQRIMMLMPVVFTATLATFPSGLVIYWAWNNALSIAQQGLIMRRMGVPIEAFDDIRMPSWLAGLFGGAGRPAGDPAAAPEAANDATPIVATAEAGPSPMTNATAAPETPPPANDIEPGGPDAPAPAPGEAGPGKARKKPKLS